jgi:molybdenum cofactor cytidylyltransferase
MRFGEVPVAEAAGAILAHSLKLGDKTFRKGRLLTPEDASALRAAGFSAIVAARLDPDDVREDEAAGRVARAGSGPRIRVAEAFTGRVNLFAEAHGLLVFDRLRLDRINLVDEAVTIGTLAPFAVVEPNQMVATIKIIPFAAPARVVERCEALAAEEGPLLRVAPFRALDVALVQTRLPGMKESILDKTVAVTRERLAALGSRLVVERRCAHDAGALADELEKLPAVGLVLICGASAIVDRRDVIPAAIVASGGRVEHFGMPVDPGNLMLIGRLGSAPTLGLPGCARSPKANGFDWVLQRLLAGLETGPADIMRMGAGGLLAEIASRPAPRAATEATLPRAPRIAAIVLAAGQSRRMGTQNKLLAEIDGKSMVRRTVDAVAASPVDPVVVVVGHELARVRAALAGTRAVAVENPDYAAGLSTSLRRGLAALPDSSDGVLVCLGDMPFVTAAEIGRLLAAFNPVEGRAICVPTRRGKRGNPVLWARRFLPEMQALSGDSGAKHLIGAHAELVVEVEMDGDAVLHDIDTPQALAEVGRQR